MFAVLGLVFSRSLLCVDRGPHQSEVIVVLGGVWNWRADGAAALFKAGAAPRIIVSGDGDGPLIRDRLVSHGVPAGAIELEDRSRNTRENAEFTARLLKQQGVHRAIVVTSWFHTRRALNCFAASAPEVRFASQPVEHPEAFPAQVVHVSREYAKTAWYFLRYGISPWRAAQP